METLPETPTRTTFDRKVEFATRAREILHEQPAVHLDTTNEEVRAFLAAHPQMEVVAVIDDAGQPSGLINRYIFAEAYAHPFAREVYGKRSCIAWMDKDPLVMDGNTPIEALVKAAVAKGPKVLKDGFIGTREGAYAGHGTGFSLMQAMEALETVKTRQLLESIDYASAIQRSHLRASEADLAAVVRDYALHWSPRDVVGGDCYFFRRTPQGLFGAVADCTGHGVPGAFMTLITLSFLGFLVGTPEGGCDPGYVLSRLNQHIKEVLSQPHEGRLPAAMRSLGRSSDDGLDAACFLLPPAGGSLTFAGARLPIIILDTRTGKGALAEGERMGLGYVATPDHHLWKSRELPLPASCRVVITTDGITDQIGGPTGISLGRKRLMEWFSQDGSRSAEALGRDFLAHFQAWQGTQARRDDATFLIFSPGAPGQTHG